MVFYLRHEMMEAETHKSSGGLESGIRDTFAWQNKAGFNVPFSFGCTPSQPIIECCITKKSSWYDYEGCTPDLAD